MFLMYSSLKKKPDWLVVFLGNPGKKYYATRHNIGFLVGDVLAEKLGVKINKADFRGYYNNTVVDDQKVGLLMPQTFMNNSGESVFAAARYHRVPPERVILVFDDLALPTGKLRIKAGGTYGGHHGVESCIKHLNSTAMPRVKIGIGRPENSQMEIVDWVTSKLTDKELAEIRPSLENAANAVIDIIRCGVQHAANEYNADTK